MTKGYLKSLLFAVLCGFYAFVATAATSLFSDYGQIQNVQNYSSNPFWSPNSPYNQRLPQPVYVQGAELTADDCTKVVQSLVSVQCMARDNCKNTDLSDIRPAIMVQLSNLPGHNYVSSCSGYLDGIFESYVKQYGNAVPNHPTAFPEATAPNPDVNNTGNSIPIQNPYKPKPLKWQQEMQERNQELQELQNQNGADKYGVSATDFPTTFEDLSFSERMNIISADIAQYKDLKAYRELNVQSESDWCEGHMDASECKAYKARHDAAQAAANATENPTTSKISNGRKVFKI